MALQPDPGRPGEPSRAAPTPILANISRRIVQLHKEFYGKGPTKAKTYYYDDIVVVLMRGGFTRVEETLHQSGRGESVKQQRSDFEQAMGHPFRQVIEEETGRKVVAFMSSSHQHPDLLGEIFVLEAAEVLGDELTSEPEDDAG
jgi:uncharacterized protein YbcI